MGLSVFLIIIGFFLLIYGADFLVDGASNIAKKMRIPEIVIGLTIVSIGTSMPELMVSLTSAVHGYQDISIGNVIGSNIANLLLILGLSALIKPVTIQKETQDFEIPICIIATFIFGMMCATGGGISTAEAIVLLIIFLYFIGYTIYITRKSQSLTPPSKESKSTKLLNDIILVIVGIVCLKVGGDITVENATNLARIFNWSEKLISITILAIGTSLPELVTSLVAAIKGNSDIAVGNIVGSNLFNILLIIGTSALIQPITYNLQYQFDLIVLIASTCMLSVFPRIEPVDKMGRVAGFIFVSLYIVYLVSAFYM